MQDVLETLYENILKNNPDFDENREVYIYILCEEYIDTREPPIDSCQLGHVFVNHVFTELSKQPQKGRLIVTYTTLFDCEVFLTISLRDFKILSTFKAFT